jgi:hypothetical protein|tara:strand:+ start:378 stop:542 length:165 start_codon:yes stop_codon:yes gene_type:complete
MYKGAMEPLSCTGVYPGDGCADWVVCVKRGAALGMRLISREKTHVELSRAEEPE